MWSAVTGINFVQVGVTPVTIGENTDIGDTIGTALNVTTNTTLGGNIGVAGDVDVFRITMTAGTAYMIGAQSYQLGSFVDPVLELLDSAGNVIVTADLDDPNAGEYITFEAPSTGTYYVRISDYGNNSTGAYELSIQQAADITFGDMDSTGAFAWSDLSGSTILRSYVNIADDWSPLDLNGYMLQTYMHELGHALGLGHAGPYNGTASWPGQALYDNDSWSATIMSYFDQDQNPNDPNLFAYLATIMRPTSSRSRTCMVRGRQGSRPEIRSGDGRNRRRHVPAAA